MLRKISLSLLMLVSLIVTLPLVNSTAHSIKYEAAHTQRRVRRHSSAWWRRHRALMRRRRAARLRRRAIAAAMRKANGDQSLRAAQMTMQTSDNHAAFSTAVSMPPTILRDANGAGSLPLPEGWSAAPLANRNETKFKVVETNGHPAGQAALSIVSAAGPNLGRLSARERQKVLAGVSYVELRRTVIDKMITTGGWVVNDLERDLGGRKVFVVVAQTPSTNDGRSPEQIWNFYFTEIDGRVYSLATSAPRQSSDRLATDAEKFITSLKPATPLTPATPASPRISIR